MSADDSVAVLEKVLSFRRVGAMAARPLSVSPVGMATSARDLGCGAAAGGPAKPGFQIETLPNGSSKALSTVGWVARIG
jgi:hypothetical protein